MQTITGRLRGLFTANVHDTIDNLERPEVMARQLLRELDGEIQGCRQRLVRALAAEKALKARAAMVARQQNEWHERAARLLAADSEAQAREALQRELRLQREARTLDEQIARSERGTVQLRGQIERLRSEQLEARSQCQLISIQARSSACLGDGEADPWSAALARRERLETYARRVGADQHTADAVAELQAQEEASFGALEAGIDDAAVDDALKGLRAELQHRNTEDDQ